MFGATEGESRRGLRCGYKVEVNENMKVVRYSDKRLWNCWREICMRRSDTEVHCMIMYVSRDGNMLDEVSG